MKKILSILLSLVLLLSAIVPSFAVGTESEKTIVPVSLDWQNVNNWIKNSATTKNIGTNTGAVAYEGTGVALDSTTFPDKGTTIKLDSNALRVSLPLATKANTNYRLSFSYYADAVTSSNLGGSSVTYALSDTGIFIPNHPAFEGVSGDRLGLAYTMSYLNMYAYNYQINTPAGQLWTVDSNGAKTGFADQNGDGAADGDLRTYKYNVEGFHNISAGEWNTLSFEFNSRNFEDIAFTLRKLAGNMWISDIKLEADFDETQYYSNPNNWLKNAETSKNIGTNEGAVAYTAGDGITLDTTTFTDKGTTLKLDSNALRVSLPLVTKANTNYRLSFSYYADAVTSSNLGGSSVTYALSDTGIFIPNHPAFEGVSGDRLGLAYTMSYLNMYAYNYQINTPAGQLWTVDSNGAKTGFADQNGDGAADGDLRTYKYNVEGFHNISAGEWNTLSFEFNSRDFEGIAFTLRKLAGINMWLSNIVLEDLTPSGGDSNAVTEYFENPDNWKASVVGSQSSPCKNILVDGISDTTVATAIPWANYTNNSTTESGSGSSLLINNPNHVSQIKLPNIETGSTYRLKFAYKPTGGTEGSSVLKFVGIFDPEFTKSKITADSSLTYSNLKTGFVAVDAYNILGAGRYRFENGVYADNCTYGSLNENIYNESEWRYEELYFKASQGLDNLYLLISYTTEAGKLLVDSFELEEVSKIPNEFIPGGATTPENPTDAWIFNASSSKNIGTNVGAVAYEGTGITLDNTTFADRGETLKLDNDAYRVSLPLKTEANTDYKLTFSYYTDTVQTVTTGDASLVGKTYAIISTGIFIPNHPAFSGISGDRLGLAYTMSYLNMYASNYQMNTPAGHLWTVDSTGSKTGFADQNGDGTADDDKRTFKPVDNYHGIETGKWYTLSFEFNSKDFNDIAFTLLKESGNMWLDDVKLEEVQEVEPNPDQKAPEQTVIDFEGEASKYSHLLIKDRVSLDTTKGHNKKDTQALHINEVREKYSNVTYPGWSTVSAMKDPVFTFPVDPNTMYSVSYWMKADKAEFSTYRQANLVVFHDWRGTHASSLKKEYMYYDIQEEPYDWVEYTLEFVTQPGQTTATFAINANSWHPSFWIDDITYTKVPAGYRSETTLSYCETPFNAVSNNKYATNGKITKKTVMELSTNINDQYIFGIDLSGKGKFTLSWDKEGKDIIRSYNVADIKGRLGALLITGSKHNKIYVTFEPAGSGISYADFYLFKRFSIGTGREMGYEENVNSRVPIRFTNIPTVSGNSVDEVRENAAILDGQLGFGELEDSSSPSTGDSLTVVTVLTITLAISAAVVLLLGKREKAR